MSTLAQLIERTRREFLSPPSALVVQTPLDAGMSTTSTTVVYTDLLMPEEEAKIGPGTLIEISSELMRVASIDTATNTLTVARGVAGTTAAAHNSPEMIYLSPRYTRQAIKDALADGVVNLYPDLYGVQTVLVDGTSGIVDLENANASHIIEAHVFTSTADWEPVRVTMLTDFPEVEVGPAVRMDDAVAQGDVYVTYAFKFSRPASEVIDLSSYGVEAHWERIVVVSAVAALLPSVDLEKSTARYLTELLAAQGVPIGEASDLSVGMLRYRALLMDEAKRALRRRYQPQVRMRKVGSWSMGRIT